jgi:hypothetical protein
MLRGILREALSSRPNLQLLDDDLAERNPAAVLRTRSPSALILGRPDCDHFRLGPLLEASPGTKILLVSSEGRSAVVYQADLLPVTVEGLSPEALLTLIAAEQLPTLPHATRGDG